MEFFVDEIFHLAKENALDEGKLGWNARSANQIGIYTGKRLRLL